MLIRKLQSEADAAGSIITMNPINPISTPVRTHCFFQPALAAFLSMSLSRFSRWLILAIATTFASVFFLPGKASAAPPQAWLGGKILDGKGGVIQKGVLVIQDGKITAVGPVDRVTIPDGAEKIDVSGRVIIPGIIDTHSHLGVYSRPAVPSNSDGNEMTGPVESSVRAMDSLNPDDPGIQMALAGGVTSANVMPGSGNVIGGQTVYVKYRGRTVEEMMIKSSRTVGGLKMANGENPKRVYGSKGKAPGTRMKTFALQREEFIKAREYMHKWDSYRSKLAEGKDVSPPEVNLDLEPLVEVLQGKRTVHFHTPSCR